MNKYILRTSFFWIVILAVMAALFVFRAHSSKNQSAMNSPKMTPPTVEVQPAAAGPAPSGKDTMPMGDQRQMLEQKMDTQLVPIQLTPERMQSIGIKNGTAEYKQINNEIRATGTVDIDQRLISYVQVRFPGYIRKVFANATYQYVRKGEPLFTIYSPDLVATQQEYLLARTNQKLLGTSTVDGVASGAESLAVAAEQRLQQWEVPQSEIAKLKQTGKPITDLVFNSPASGYITEYNALPNMFVEPSTKLYTLADLSRVWVNAQVFQDDISKVKPGDTAQILVDTYPGRGFSGRIEQILPQVDMATRTVRVRLVVANSGLKLKPGMFVNVVLKSSMGRQLVIPATAVFQTGTRQVVFLDQGDGNLEPKEITLGARVGDDFVVLKGLKQHQSIVTSANFLLDSESQLQAAAGSYTPPPPGAGNSPQGAQANVEFTSDPTPPQRGNNTFRVKVIDASGSPVTGAEVAIKFYMAAMPAMSMAALDANVKLREKEGGLYEGSGTLQSGGSWQATITVQKNGQTLATKQVRVNAMGAMA